MAPRREFLKIAITGTIGLAVGAIIGSSISSSKIAELESEIERLKRKLSARSSTIFPPATTRGKPEGAINIYNWSYYIQEALLDVFSQETGIPREKIVYDIFEDPAEPFAKLEAGGSGY
ncbi:MAG: hypothetical protein J7J44_09150, partial [Deltaproteobacteria bacterium]|nr:hypothetical protein [Deltaproteobacteria bacterium]